MKNLIYIPLLLVIALFSNCEEEGPFIILTPPEAPLLDTSYISMNMVMAAPRNVLIEEFSGVRCANCPDGNAKIEELLMDYPGRVIPISAHSDFLAAPYSGDQDLRNEDANDLVDLIGGLSSKPSAAINRKLFDGEANIAIKNPDTWEQFVWDEMAINTPVNITMELIEKNDTARTIQFRIKLAYSAMASDHNLGIALIENKIIADQQDGIVHVEDYEHQHVLRKYVSPIVGTSITTTLVANTIIIKEFEIDLDEYDADQIWQLENMALITFIRQPNNEIVNAQMLEW